MINKKYFHFTHFDTFMSKKLSANIDNTLYTIGLSDDVIEGEPEIPYQSIVYIKDKKCLFTHGKLYDASGTATKLKEAVKINGVDFDGSEDIVTNIWGTEREFTISDSSKKNEGESVKVNGESNVSLLLPRNIDANVTNDSEGNKISNTYTTKQELTEAMDELPTFLVYSSDTDTDPTLSSTPASSWTTEELLKQHAGDYYVTSSGRIFQFIEDPISGWTWKELTDYYLYECQKSLKKIESKVDITGEWDAVQTKVETGDIYVRGERKSDQAYLDVLCCNQAVTYKLSGAYTIYLPFIYNYVYTKTRTRYNAASSHLITESELAKASGKTIIITNSSDSTEKLTINYGDNESGLNNNVKLNPGEYCALKFKVSVVSGSIFYYWVEADEDIIPVATKDKLGVIKVGDGLNIDTNGKLSAVEKIKDIQVLGNSIIGSDGVANICAFRKTDSDGYVFSNLTDSTATGYNSIVLGYGRAFGFSSVYIGGSSYKAMNQGAKNDYEVAVGKMPLSSSNGQNTDEDTIFTVGNGYDPGGWGYSGFHNAFEVRRNGDIYIPDPSWTGTEYWNRPMTKLTLRSSTTCVHLSEIELNSVRFLVNQESDVFNYFVNIDDDKEYKLAFNQEDLYSRVIHLTISVSSTLTVPLDVNSVYNPDDVIAGEITSNTAADLNCGNQIEIKYPGSYDISIINGNVHLDFCYSYYNNRIDPRKIYKTIESYNATTGYHYIYYNSKIQITNPKFFFKINTVGKKYRLMIFNSADSDAVDACPQFEVVLALETELEEAIDFSNLYNPLDTKFATFNASSDSPEIKEVGLYHLYYNTICIDDGTSYKTVSVKKYAL